MKNEKKLYSDCGCHLHSTHQLTRYTMADELINAIFTATPVLARIRLALIYIAKTPRIVVTTWTLATEAVDQVYTHSPVGTGV